MPIYEFICKKCGEKFEIFTQKLNDNKASCPKCGSEDTNKVISPLGYMKHPDDSGPGHRQSKSCSTGGCGSGK